MKQPINILAKQAYKKLLFFIPNSSFLTPHLKHFSFLIIFSLLISNFSFSQVFSDNFNGIDSIWINFGNDGVISSFCNEGDTVLYIAGAIKYVNDMLVNRIFSWNTETIKTYENNGISNEIKCINKYNDTLYIGGDFQNFIDPSRNYICYWNGNAWQGFAAGQPSGKVYDMIEYDGKLFICGMFGTVGGLTRNMIAAYNGSTWENVGSFPIDLYALEIFNGELYAAGYPSFGIKKYLGGTNWEAFTIKPNGYINNMVADTFNTFLYVGGQFTKIGNIPSIGCTMWDGFNWHAMDYIHGNTVYENAMVVYRGDLYTGHGTVFPEAGGVEIFINRWNGESWDSIGGGFNSQILALEIFQNELYIGGGFRTYDGQRSKGMRKMSFPDNGCNYIKPRINTLSDTFRLFEGTAEVQFYNNNPYVDTWEWDFGDGNIAYEKNPVHIYSQVGTYDVSIKVTHEGCEKSYTTTIRVNQEIGIDEQMLNKFEIYPNPSSDDFYVITEAPQGYEAEIRINGLNGHLKTVIPVTSEKTLINTEYWSKGTYLCSLYIDGKIVKTEKIILN